VTRGGASPKGLGSVGRFTPLGITTLRLLYFSTFLYSSKSRTYKHDHRGAVLLKLKLGMALESDWFYIEKYI